MTRAYVCIRNFLYFLSKVAYPLALLFMAVSVILAWIGFAVPDWIMYTNYLAAQTKFGLWTVCIQSYTFFSSGYTCSSWSASGYSLPDFIRTTQGLVTVGCIFATFALGLGIAAPFFKRGVLRLFPIFAGLLALASFIFILIGVATFAGDYSDYVKGIAGTYYTRRWGYWIFVPVLFFILIASVLFPYNFIYKNYIANRLFDFTDNKLTTRDLPLRGNLYGMAPQYSARRHPAVVPGLAPNVMNNIDYCPKLNRTMQSAVSSHVILPSMQADKPNSTANTPSHQSRQKSILKQQSFNPTSIMKDIVEPVFDTDPDFMNGESAINRYLEQETCYMKENHHPHHHSYQQHHQQQNRAQERYFDAVIKNNVGSNKRSAAKLISGKKSEESRWSWERIKNFNRGSHN